LYNYGSIGNIFNNKYIECQFTDIGTAGSSANFNFSTNKYTAQYSGNYNISAFLDLLADNLGMSAYFSASNCVFYSFNCTVKLAIVKASASGFAGATSILKSELLSTNTASYNNTAVPVSSISSIASTSTGVSTVAKTVYLAAGESISVGLYVEYTCTTISNGLTPVNTYLTLSPTFLSTVNLTVDLSPELVFGGLITYSSILPKIKASDYFKDICIRFGLLPTINEDTKTVTLNKFDELYTNINSAIDWSDKLDNKEPEIITFKYNSYAQNNLFEHKEDKTIVTTDQESNYNLIINNANLELNKTIYESPFAVTENATFDTTTTMSIDLYNTTTSKFTNDVQPRIGFSEMVIGSFKFTDGTTTSAYIDVRRVWFIDQAVPTLSAGFGFLIPNNSDVIIDALQNLKLLKVKVKLNLLDILNLDFLIPVYIAKYNSYFFISNINQYNYTDDKLTLVELVKLNP
jgi:hypothetical protein